MSLHRNCEGVTRRDCLQLGLGVLAGGSFVNLLGLAARGAEAAAEAGAAPRGVRPIAS